MNTLKPLVFVVPVIALILVSLLYVFLRQKTTHKKSFTRFIVTTAILGFLLNLAWELLQMPLYNSTSFSINHVTFCALGSVADAIMVLLIYLGLALIFKQPLWVYPLLWQRILIVILIGGVGAVLSEMRHLSVGNWAYSGLMPLIPVVQVGLSPVLQFMTLPSIIYILSFNCRKFLPFNRLST